MHGQNGYLFLFSNKESTLRKAVPSALRIRASMHLGMLSAVSR